MESPEIIKGRSISDHRGVVSFINGFQMDEIKRFYLIKHTELDFVRGWRGHKMEQRWFYTFLIKVVKIDNWEIPHAGLQQLSFELGADRMQILHIPTGYATALQVLEENSELMVFADYGIENAEKDDYSYPIGYFF